MSAVAGGVIVIIGAEDAPASSNDHAGSDLATVH